MSGKLPQSVKTLSVLHRSFPKGFDLLQQRICSLRPFLDEALLKKSTHFLNNELEAQNLDFRPKLYFGDEWFSPEGMNAIAIPFYLGHPLLESLEKAQMSSIEGADCQSFMRLLRHEAGHCFDHCYQFSKRRKWKLIFGSPRIPYRPDHYKPDLTSRNHVINLEYGYAQAHPDEDFAETFAVWLDPTRNWRKEYRQWPVALKKLNYVEELALESKELENLSEKGRLPYSASQLKATLQNFYRKRKRNLTETIPNQRGNKRGKR